MQEVNKPASWASTLAGAVLVGWLGLASAQQAAAPSEAALVGPWDMAHADDNPDHCRIQLLAGETIGGRELRLGKGCAQALAWTSDLTAWRLQPDGTLVLADAQRHAVIGFKRDEAGDLTGTGPDHALYVLYRAVAQGRRK
jgi:hypothetical protein